MSDLVKRLRDTPNWKREEYGDYKSSRTHYDIAPLEAADRIEALEAENKRLKEDARWAYINGAMDEHQGEVIRPDVIISHIAAELRDGGYFVPPTVLARAWENVFKNLAALKGGE